MEQMITEGPVYTDNTGWICPKCGTVVSPRLSTCPHCEAASAVTIKIPSTAPNVTTTLDLNDNKSNEQMIFS